MKDLKNIKIETPAFIKIKEYCNKNGYKIYHWATKILLNEIEKGKK